MMPKTLARLETARQARKDIVGLREKQVREFILEFVSLYRERPSGYEISVELELHSSQVYRLLKSLRGRDSYVSHLFSLTIGESREHLRKSKCSECKL